MSDRSKAIYLEEISTIKSLTEEESRKCLKAYLDGREEALTELIEGNLYRVRDYLDRCVISEEFYMDAVQEGNLALMEAASRLSADMNIETVLGAAVEKAVGAFLEEENDAGKASEELAARLNVIDRVCETIAKEQGREATAEEVAEMMKMEVEDVRYLMQIALSAIKKD